MGNWISNHPTLVAQILRISSSYSPPPPEGTISPMTWGVENDVVERFGAAGISEDQIACARDTYTFSYAGRPADFVAAFRAYYGPTMNAFEAAEKNGKATELEREWLCFRRRTCVQAQIGPRFPPLSCGSPLRSEDDRAVGDDDMSKYYIDCREVAWGDCTFTAEAETVEDIACRVARCLPVTLTVTPTMQFLP
jgi:hypothetical protein